MTSVLIRKEKFGYRHKQGENAVIKEAEIGAMHHKQWSAKEYRNRERGMEQILRHVLQKVPSLLKC